jgi:mono/diheme cytochrome c family protein
MSKLNRVHGALAALVLATVGCMGGNAQTTQPAATAESTGLANLPEGDAAAGEALFNGTAAEGQELACHACHTLDGTIRVGPSLQGVSGRIPDGYNSAEAYIYESIVDPDAYIRDGYQPDIMPNHFGTLNPQTLADLIAFVSQQ